MLENGDIRVFSRNQENNTSKYPDVIRDLPELMAEGVTSFIIDCEAVAYDEEHDCLLPFQVLTTRKRKDADVDNIKVKVCLFPFDLLALNGVSYVRESFRKRRETLHKSFAPKKGKLQYATSHIASDPDEIAELLDQSIKDSCEGLMVKTLGENSTYDIATRSKSWLKLKKDYLDGVGDTLDLVVIGAWIGKGKRTGAYGGFLLACYDPESEVYQSICKIGTGFSDDDLKTHYESLKEFAIDGPKSYYQICTSDNSLEPDVWFDAKQVWEVKCADLSISPKHRAANGLVDPEKGTVRVFRQGFTLEDAISSHTPARLTARLKRVGV
jgi:DNA ligase-1